MNIKRKIIALCLGLSVATTFVPPVQGLSLGTGIKIAMMGFIGLTSGLNACVKANSLLGSFIDSDTYYEQIEQNLNENNPDANTPFRRFATANKKRLWTTTDAYVSGFIAYIMFQTIKKDYNG